MSLSVPGPPVLSLSMTALEIRLVSFSSNDLLLG